MSYWVPNLFGLVLHQSKELRKLPSARLDDDDDAGNDDDYDIGV